LLVIPIGFQFFLTVNANDFFLNGNLPRCVQPSSSSIRLKLGQASFKLLHCAFSFG
jgi:hypothetical protein